MRILVQNYTFNKGTKQITLSDYQTIKLESVLAVIDVTNNKTIYQSNDPNRGGSVSGNILTLDYDTNTADFDNSDKLQIFYEKQDDQATETTLADIKTSVQLLDNAVDGNELQVDIVSSALPAGAATEATLLDVLAVTATPGTAGSPSGDVITVQGTASMTALKVDGSAVTQPVSGTVTANAGTGSFTVVQSTAENLKASVEQAGTWNLTDISGTISLPTGAATSAKQPALGTAGTPSSDVLTVQGAASMTALKVDGSAVTQPVSASSLPLPTGAATESTLSSLNTKVPSQGQALMAASVPVVIASNQTAIPVSGSLTAGKLSVVDLLDANILDTSITNIPGSASSPVQVIASTAAEIKAIQLLDTTGAFVGVYVGGIGSEVLKFVMGPGSDQTIEHNIPAASRVSLKRLDSTTAVSSGIVAFNCLG